MKIFTVVFIITLLGAYLRFNNLSSYLIYPDSYQNLIVSENILNYKSVVGFLGENGMFYPPFFWWSRPIFALLISLGSYFFSDSSQVALGITYFFGVLSIPLSFLLIKQLFNSDLAGIASSIILAISFNHTVWGGFIQTETTSVFVMLVFLLSFFRSVKKEEKLASFDDLLAGVLFSILVFTRYEYIVLIIPIFVYLFSSRKLSKVKIVNLFSSFLFTSTIILYLLFPIWDTVGIVLSQVNNFIKIFLGALFIAILLLVKKKYIPQKVWNYLPNTIIFLLGIFFSYLVLQNFFPKIFTLFYTDLLAVRDFFATDLVLGVLGFLGIVKLIKSKHQNIAIFSLISILILGFIYYKVNPTMQRYWTHLIPYLLIPASYGLLTFSIRMMGGLVVASIVLFQLYLTFNGIHNWYNGEWFRESYTQKSANFIKQKITDQNTILIASFPEPYYYYTKLSTHSINDKPPYIYIDDSLNNYQILIIQDMGMKDIFPNFSKFLDEKYQHKKVEQYFVGEKYHYKEYSKAELHPVVLYKSTLGELKEAIFK